MTIKHFQIYWRFSQRTLCFLDACKQILQKQDGDLDGFFGLYDFLSQFKTQTAYQDYWQSPCTQCGLYLFITELLAPRALPSTYYMLRIM